MKLRNGDIYDDVSLSDTDERKDIAILKIKAINLPYLAMSDSDSIKIGSEIFAIGAPHGLEGSISSGIMSSIRSAGDLNSELSGFKVIQFTAPISPGSSGSPLVDSYGKVIGLAFASRTNAQNLNVGIPINYIAPLVLNAKGAGKALARISDVKPVAIEAQSSSKGTIDDLGGVYSGTWASEKFPVSGTLVLTISLKDDVATVKAVFMGSEILNQEDLATKFTSIGGGVWKMEYVGKTSGIRGTGVLNDGRFAGDYIFDPDDSGKWTLAVKGKDAAPIQVAPAPAQTSQAQSNPDDYEYGTLSELKGVKKIYIETGTNTSHRDKIITELQKLNLGLQILGSETEAECVVLFASKTIYEPWAGGNTAVWDKESGAGMIFLVGKQGKRNKLLYTFKDKQNTWLESKPSTNFAKTVAKAFRDANR